MWKLILILVLFFSNNSFSQNIDHWETAILADDNWKYRIGNSEPPSDWYLSYFDDSNWQEAQGGIGYGDGDDNTTIPSTTSLYLRKNFDIVDIDHLEFGLLHADFDDGFIAYLNGVEIARFNMEGDFPPYNSTTPDFHEAQVYQGGSPNFFLINKNKITQCLQSGSNNTLAIQVHNESFSSSDLTSNFHFSLAINISDTNYSPTPSWFFVPELFSDLPIIKINTSGQEIPNEPKLTAHMGIIDNGVGNQNYIFSDDYNGYDGFIGIETRGASSLVLFPKINYGLETRDSLGENNNVSLLGMPEENDWILHGPYSDKTLMRNVLAFHIGRKMGRWAPRTRYCELYINDEYFGVYVLMEKIKRDPNRVDIAKLTPQDIEGDELTGGYIVQIDREEFGNSWSSPFTPFPYFVYHHPNASDLTVEQELYIRQYITDFETNLAGGAFDHPLFGYAQFIDVPSFIDYLLAIEITKEVDAYRLSAYLHKDKNSNGGKLKAGPLWDFNLGFGNATDCGVWDPEGWAFDEPQCEPVQPFWWDRFLEDENFANQVNCRWKELRSGPLQTDSILQFIDEQVALLENAQERNFNHWGGLGEYVWPNWFIGNSFQEEINFLKTWTFDRFEWMDNNMVGDCDLVSNNNLEFDSELKVFPNPFSESVDFIFGKNDFEKSSIQIFDSVGKQIRVLDFNKTEIHWDGKNSSGKEVAAGVYFYLFSNKNKIVSGKILKF